MKLFDHIRCFVSFNKRRLAETTTNLNVLRILSRDRYWIVKCNVCDNPYVTPEILDFLSYDSDYLVRFHVAIHPKTPLFVLNRLVNDRDVQVWDTILDNPNVTETLRRQIKLKRLIHNKNRQSISWHTDATPTQT